MARSQPSETTQLMRITGRAHQPFYIRELARVPAKLIRRRHQGAEVSSVLSQSPARSASSQEASDN